MIIDTHCHFDMMPNPEAYIRQKEDAGDIVIGMTNLPSHFRLGVHHVKTYKQIRLAIGMHPLLAAESRNEIAQFKNYIDKTSYVGEIGLDFSREGRLTKGAQVEVLHEILRSLKGKKKIISVHSRKAERELLNLLREYEIENVIFHWYSGPVSLIPKIIDCGYYFSINEAMTLSSWGQKIIKAIPRNRLLTESDAPFNKSCSISNTLRNIGVSEIEITQNFMSLIRHLK